MKVYLNKEYKCVKVEDNTFVANDSSNYIRYYFVTNANGDVIDKMDDTSVIYRNTEPSYVTVAFRRADGDVIQHLMASPKTDATGKSFFEYEITNTDGVLYKKGALEISAQFIEATLSETGGVKKVISQKVKAIAINTAHVLDNIGEEAEEYYSQYEQANNDAHAVLQTQITTNFNNIGTLQDLTTDAKDDLVKAINEVDAHADANKSEIGDLSTLTTDEKTTIVGAINEVDAHADANKAEIGNLSALTTDEKATLVGAINEVDNHADNATTLANNAVATANGAVATANEAKTTAQTAETNANSAVDTANAANATADEAKAIAQGSQRAIGFATLQAAITALNGYSNTQLKVGDNVYIVETGVPDLWVAAVEPNSVAYNYTTNDAFNDDLVENTLVQVGYYKFAYLESDGKPCTVAWQNMTVAESDWVASTEFADFPYEAKIILTDFVNFSSIPQVVFGLTEATSGNYAPICKAGDKGVYIYSKVNTAITLPTVVTFAPNVHGASMQGGGYTNKGKWVASTTYAIDDLVYTDNGQFVCIEGITSTTSPEQDTTHWQATFVATGKTKNGLTISGQDNGTGVQKTFDGSQAVEVAFDETTMTAKEVNGVLKVGAKGTIPEALPQEASALKSGELPTSGWDTNTPFFEGELNLPYGDNSEIKICDGDYRAVKVDLTVTAKATTNYEAGENISTVTKTKNSGSASVLVTFSFSSSRSNDAQFMFKEDGIYVKLFNSPYTSYGCRLTLLKAQAPQVGGTPCYTISDTSITANSDILMELTDEGGVKSYSMEAGKITVIRDTAPTQPIPYTYKVKQTNASGQFTLVNHYVPSIPESPTSLPVTYKKVSGELPTSGWENEVRSADLWNGSVNVGGYGGSPAYNVPASAEQDLKNIVYHKTGRLYLYTDDGKEFVCTYSESASTSSEYTYTGITDGIKMGISTNVDASPLTISARNLDSANHTVVAMSTYKLVSGNKTFTISDTDITANTSVKMYLTDEGGVKAYSKAVGSIQVIRDSVPTTAIPYEYEVEQTSAEGLFEVINAYVPTKTSQLTNDSGFAKTTEANTWTGVQTFSNADGIKTDRVHNLDNNDAWYNFDGSNNRFGSPSRPTIIRTSEARPRAQVPSGETTVTKAIALLEDIPSASQLTNDSGFAKTTEANTWTGVQTFSNADGIKTDRVHNLDNNDAWYNFDGSNNRFGSPSRPTIIRTSEARPRAQVPSGETTVTKAIALLEDIPSAGEWVTVTGETATLTEAGTYQVLFGASYRVQSIIYWDGTNGADGIYSTVATAVSNNRISITSRYPSVTAGGVLSIYFATVTADNGVWTEETTAQSGFKYRKIN